MNKKVALDVIQKSPKNMVIVAINNSINAFLVDPNLLEVSRFLPRIYGSLMFMESKPINS